MKHIIKISEFINTDVVTRKTVENIEKTLNREDEYLFDMTGVTYISRSAADEFFNVAHCDYHVVLVNMEPFVKKMMDVVSVGRFKTRVREDEYDEVIHCPDMESLSKCLLS
jgi:anti-anti-sigma regulatory factor